MWHILMWHNLFTLKSFTKNVRIADSIPILRTNMLATIRLVLSITWVYNTPDPGYLDHVLIRLDSTLYRNQSTAKKLSNSVWTALRRRVGRLWLRIHFYGITLLRVQLNRGQFPRKTCHIRMCHIHISYRILPQYTINEMIISCRPFTGHIAKVTMLWFLKDANMKI